MIDFAIDWKDAPGVRDPVLARTWCALTIRVGGEPVTRVFDRRTKGWRNSVYGSVFPLCRWVVDSLWFLLYEPYRWPIPYGSRDLARNDADRPWVHRHSLLAAREGGALPDLTLFRDGDTVLARWLRDGGDASHPSLRFVQEGQMRLSPDAVRNSIEFLVQTVLERVPDLAHTDIAQLRDDWHDLRNMTPDETNLCAWSARLGINAHYNDELSESAAERLRAAAGRLDGRIAEDLLDASTLDTIPSDLEWIDDAHRCVRAARRASTDDLPLHQRWHGRLGESGSTAYAAGYGDARALRAHAGIGTRTLPDMSALLQRLGWADAPLVATDTSPSAGLHAVVDHGPKDVPVLAAHPPADEPSKRFLLARSLFLQAASGNTERRLVTSSHTWDQRASRAFAAELLAPADALRDRIRSDSVSAREVAQYAEEFIVDPVLIERQLENHAVAQVDRGRQDLRQW